MKQPPSFTRRGVLAGLAGSAFGLPAFAQSGFPNRPVKIIVPWPAGGGSDVSVRLLVPGLTQRLGQPVVIDNKAGASGAIGHALAARSPADGYTLLYSTADTHSIVSHTHAQPPFDARKDFVGIATMGLYPMGLAVHASVPARNVKEFVAWAGEQKPAVGYGTVGVGSAGHILCEAFRDTAKVDMLHVPFEGRRPAHAGAAGQPDRHHLHARGLARPAPAQRRGAHDRRDRPRAAAQLSRRAHFQGAGHPAGEWLPGGIVAPTGLPANIVAQLHDAIEATLADPGPAEQNRKLSTLVERMAQPDFHRYMLAEYDRWGRYIKAANITVT
ncbi:tripartite tricarboxylate transporter substrate binding protein [Ramlibacter terrae]|uniref:Tripartite tricarboxylate transporter substrate binding protein n=1 Tax=Ramlibacter terrae TaxID=2732511 RepID=A0ABX6P4W7_9BURK|nr:tripartite tricarboxylate transporter substrate binding protein [Ramlibacter terrae]